jgi:hypothetical protein
MKKKVVFCLPAAIAAGVLLTECGNIGSHSLRLQLTVALDSTALHVTNASRTTYYRTTLDVNDDFGWAVGTLPPGAHRAIQLASLHDGQGQRYTRRIQVAEISAYAQDSVGNFNGFSWKPTAKKR